MNEMKGLIRKDWLLMSRQLKLMLVYILVFTVIFSLALKESNALVSFFSVLMFLMAINCFAYDEQVNFDKLIAASPVSIRNVVLARYAAALLVGIGGSAALTLVNFIVMMYHNPGETTPQDALLTFVGGVAAALLLVSVMFPIFYKFGVNKSRLIILLVFAVPALLYFGFVALFPHFDFSSLALPDGLMNALPYLLAVIFIAFLVGSVYLSSHILKKKEY